MSFVLSVLPLLLIIGTGYALAKSGVLPKADWKGIETLSFRVLIPAILILAITGTDLSWAAYGPFMLTLLVTFAVMAACALLLRLLPRDLLDNPAFTSLFQSGVRWNAFVVLAAAEQFTGEASLGAIAVAIAVLIPSINITCIVVLTTFGPQKTTPVGIVKSVLKNPLVQACLIGLAVYFSGVSLPVPVTEALELVGRGALAVGLLAIGAGISLRRLTRWDWKVALAAVLRPLAGPLLFVGIAFALDLTPLQTFAGVMIFAAPAASNGYILAKQMGGDADLYADVLTWQTLLSLVALPLWAGVLLG